MKESPESSNSQNKKSGKKLWGFLKRPAALMLSAKLPAKKKKSEPCFCLECNTILARSTESYKKRHLEQKHKDLLENNNLTVFVSADHESAKRAQTIEKVKNTDAYPSSEISASKSSIPIFSETYSELAELHSEASGSEVNQPTVSGKKLNLTTEVNSSPSLGSQSQKTFAKNFEQKTSTDICEKTQKSIEGFVNAGYADDDSEASSRSKKSDNGALQSDINQIKLMLSSLTVEQKATDSKIKYVGENEIKQAQNLMEVSHPDIYIEAEDDYCKVTCVCCQNYIKAHTNVKKMLSSHLAYGNSLVYEEKKREQLISGGNQTWYSFKMSLQEHLSCHSSRSGGQFHFKAKQFEMKTSKSEKEHIRLNTAVVSAGIEVCKMKAAAYSFESLISLLSFCGTDGGDIGHSKNQFPDIVKAAYQYILNKTKKYMETPLPSTGMRPHFSTAVDKSTPHRDTNQAIVIIIPVDGVRVAVPIDAPLVYKISEPGSDVLSGGTGADLADQVINTLEKIGITGEGLSYLRAVHADGQYQAKTFQDSLRAHMHGVGTQIDNYFLMPWDPSHWIDIVMEEVRERNLTTSPFLKRLVKRSNKLYKMFGHGRGHQEYKGLAKSLGLRALETVTFATTRFFSSAYEQWDKIYLCYESLIKAYCTFRQTTDKEEETKYEIRGQDFVIDICGALDVLFPVTLLMVKAQTVNIPVWKIAIWFPKVICHLQEIENDLAAVKEGARPTKRLLPKLAENWDTMTIYTEDDEEQHGTFRGVELLEGWIVSGEEVEQDLGKKKITYTWESRSPIECITDLECLAREVRHTLQKKYDVAVTKEVKSMANIFDVEVATSILSTHRLDILNQKLHIETEERVTWETHGREEFVAFFKEICHLPHIKEHFNSRLDRDMLPHSHSIILKRFKDTLRDIIWFDLGGVRSHIFLDARGKAITSLSSQMIESFNEVDSTSFSLDQWYMLRFENGEQVVAQLNGEAFYSCFYTNETIYSAIGQEMCVCLDVALGANGCEAVVEGFYSVVKVHKKSGGQSNDNLTFRAIVDWNLPHPVSCPNTMKAITKLFIEGDEENGLKKHRSVRFFDHRERTVNKYRESKVIDRRMKEKPRCPHIIDNNDK